MSNFGQALIVRITAVNHVAAIYRQRSELAHRRTPDRQLHKPCPQETQRVPAEMPDEIASVFHCLTFARESGPLPCFPPKLLAAKIRPAKASNRATKAASPAGWAEVGKRP
jgi:hypothetical protein